MSTAKAPVWAITDVMVAVSNDPCACYLLTFNGKPAAELRVDYTVSAVGGKARTISTLTFEKGHEDKDGALITYLALRALYDNQAEQRLRTGGSEDFEYVHEAFEFVGSLLTFTY